jgi:hypothetical protein
MATRQDDLEHGTNAAYVAGRVSMAGQLDWWVKDSQLWWPSGREVGTADSTLNCPGLAEGGFSRQRLLSGACVDGVLVSCSIGVWQPIELYRRSLWNQCNHDRVASSRSSTPRKGLPWLTHRFCGSRSLTRPCVLVGVADSADGASAPASAPLWRCCSTSHATASPALIAGNNPADPAVGFPRAALASRVLVAASRTA